MTRLYIAGSGADLDRAARWIGLARAAGFEVENDWPAAIRRVGERHPGGDPGLVAFNACYGPVRRADAFWLLSPPSDRPTVGAWVELGLAVEECGEIVISGPTAFDNIFHRLGHHVQKSDEVAFEHLLDLYGLDDPREMY